MVNPKLSIIAALQASDRGLGRNNDLLFRIQADLTWFKKITLGHPVIMGRKTFESIGRLLPGRANIIITRDMEWNAPGAIVTHSLEDAIHEAQKIEHSEIFIIGGGSIYRESLPVTNRLYLTLVDSTAPADVFFPAYENDFVKNIEHTEEAVDPASGLHFHHVILERN